ncbi:MAG: 50S ribosome-binding GTPase [Oscillospiraceae bacterium]|jgi:ribosome biogenesis GTPase A|nr:50S ribosome-binding GTPase [Oscillospiraceae bacterium]
MKLPQLISNDSNVSFSQFPGYAAKFEKKLSDIIKFSDFVIEIVDARIPVSSRNSRIENYIGSKPLLVVLNKSDLASTFFTEKWINYFKSIGIYAISANSKFDSLNKKIRKYISFLNFSLKRRPRTVVLGVPNVGKSSFINNILNRCKTKIENRPSVTKKVDWFSCGNYELCDTPGILAPKIFGENVLKNLVIAGVIEHKDIFEIVIDLINLIRINNNSDLFKLDDSYEILKNFGKSRGFLLSDGKINVDLAASSFLNDFRKNKFGRMTLEAPDD